MTPQELVVRAIFLSGYARRAYQLREATSALLYRYSSILMRDYRNGLSERAVNSLAYIQLHQLLEVVCAPVEK